MTAGTLGRTTSLLSRDNRLYRIRIGVLVLSFAALVKDLSGVPRRDQGALRFEIGRILHLKSEISDWTACPRAIAGPIRDFGFRI